MTRKPAKKRTAKAKKSTPEPQAQPLPPETEQQVTINPPEHEHHEHVVSHRAVDTIVRQYILNHMDRYPGCQINECQAMVECCLREDFGCCKESLGCVLDSLEWQLPVLHALKGGSSV